MSGDERLRRHLGGSVKAVAALEVDLARLDHWGEELALVLAGGGRLLAAGNGGSAAEAQHLTAELVGRYRSERPALSAIALHAETSSLTAIVNDYGPDRGFARQVEAHGRPGDVLLAISTSGSSPNLLAAVDAGRLAGLRCLALSGGSPNPLAERCHDALCVEGPAPAVQEAHLVAIHLMCESLDAALSAKSAPVAPAMAVLPLTMSGVARSGVARSGVARSGVARSGVATEAQR